MKYCYKRKLLILLFRYSVIPYSGFYCLPVSIVPITTILFSYVVFQDSYSCMHV